MQSRIRNLLLSIGGGLALSIAWPVSSLAGFVFIGFVPLLFLVHFNKGKSVFLYLLLSFLIFNVGTTWWVINSTPFAILAFVCNALFMCLPWWGFTIFYKKYSTAVAYLGLVSCWLLFEYIHLNWQLSWPWLTIGNVFAYSTEWVQWYSFTGVGGGTLWVFLVNISVFEVLKNKDFSNKLQYLVPVSLIVLPILFSIILLNNHKIPANDTTKNVIIVQPNIDPYAKNDFANIQHQLEKLISLSEKEIDTATCLVIWPETALAQGILQSELLTVPCYEPVVAFLKRHPKVTLLTGLDSYKCYGLEKLTRTAFKQQDGKYYDAFNTAVSLKSTTPPEFYNKSKLVPGVETLPSFFDFLAPFFEKFGGTTGGYGVDTNSKIFETAKNPYKTAPIICYESIYGEYVASYVAKGGNLLTIMTNDGWWGNTPGHKQHFAYAKLRAIETHRYVARSANTGISAVINSQGEIVESRPWDTATFIKTNIPIDTDNTFYTKYGDYIFKFGSGIAICVLLYNLIISIGNILLNSKIKKRNS